MHRNKPQFNRLLELELMGDAMKDGIIREVWKTKDTLAAKCGHDVRVLVEFLQAQESVSSVKSVDLHARRRCICRTGR